MGRIETALDRTLKHGRADSLVDEIQKDLRVRMATPAIQHGDKQTCIRASEDAARGTGRQGEPQRRVRRRPRPAGLAARIARP
jgi:hypothetical protein